MSSYKKKIAVIGGGSSGICSIAALKEEGGFEPVCFEITSKPGGTWYYREESVEGLPSIMPTTVVNQSKEIGALSNFPPRKEYNIFMTHQELFQYIMEYANLKDVLKHIHYNREVTSVRRSDDYKETGKWNISVKNTISGEVNTDVFDGVLVCVGHFNRPKMASYRGQNTFKGKLMHTHSLKDVEPYRNKRIVVVGMGCSALDAAVETSNVAAQVYLSTRSGAHVIKRIGYRGYPYDYIWSRRILHHLFKMLPARVASWIREILVTESYNKPRLYRVKPDHYVFSKEPTFNDQIGSRLLSGVIIQKPDIRCFTEDGVIFDGDSEVTKADVVVMATGYTWEFPFLEEGVVVQEDNRINLYKCMFPSQLPHATLGIIGFVLPYGPGFCVVELQCRWAAQILAGKCKLPSQEAMLKDVKDRYDSNCLSYTGHEKMSIRVRYAQFCDDLASQFGAKPNFLKLFLTDIRLFLKIVFGPNLTYQYRLQGPHSWNGAREGIMNSKYRMMWPINQKRRSIANDGNQLNRLFKQLVTLLLLFHVILYVCY